MKTAVYALREWNDGSVMPRHYRAARSDRPNARVIGCITKMAATSVVLASSGLWPSEVEGKCGTGAAVGQSARLGLEPDQARGRGMDARFCDAYPPRVVLHVLQEVEGRSSKCT